MSAELIAKIRAEIDTDVRLANGEDEQAHNERHWPDRIERQARAFRKILDEIVSEANWLDLSVDLDRRVGLRDESVEPLLGNVLVRILAEAYEIEVES